MKTDLGSTNREEPSQQGPSSQTQISSAVRTLELHCIKPFPDDPVSVLNTAFSKVACGHQLGLGCLLEPLSPPPHFVRC